MTRQEAFTLLGVYILGMVWIIQNYTYDISLVLCPTKILFGIPCPGCGMTRAVKLCLEGELLADLTEEAFCAFIVIQLKSAKQIIRIL